MWCFVLYRCRSSFQILANRMAMKARKSQEKSDSHAAGKPVSASRSEMAEVVLPAQTNPLGKLLGGHVMHLVDIAAAMADHPPSNSNIVTASGHFIHLPNPPRLR